MEVLNKRAGHPVGAVYVGRPTKWGNPFIIGKDGDRDECIHKYEEWILNNDSLISQLDQLRGRDLVCWCAPQPCHADVLMRLANKYNGDRE